jgi:hypothetical protein
LTAEGGYSLDHEITFGEIRSACRRKHKNILCLLPLPTINDIECNPPSLIKVKRTTPYKNLCIMKVDIGATTIRRYATESQLLAEPLHCTSA